jgi:uncharacterized small protein (DUF1192 family)
MAVHGLVRHWERRPQEQPSRLLKEEIKYMASSELHARVAALEAEVARIKEQLRDRPASKKEDWLDNWYGKFANDPYFEEAMRLGQKYRESLRPKKVKKTAKKATATSARRSPKAG